MGKLLDHMESALTDAGWLFEPLDGLAGLRTIVETSTAQWPVLVLEYAEEQQVVTYSVMPASTPPSKLLVMMEFITRVNYDLPVGNFELDLDDGEVRFKNAIDLEGGELTDEMANVLLFTNVDTMAHYMPGLAAVLQGTASPAQALALCEAEDEDEDWLEA
ncbi:MAG: YbjN domain-containing protein [Deltaproteobacteria bacterium]|nr:MAG: YbjN domain-containing protein [Deltaproteobacteria bacterium]